MELDATRPIVQPKTVVYRCPCGNQLTVAIDTGGTCEKCQRQVSAKSLAFDQTSSTVAWEEQNFELAKTQPGLFAAGQPTGPGVVIEDEVAADDPAQLIGKRFGHFEIIAPIGRGGMGQVYRALDTSLQRYVAVKVLRSGIASSESQPASSSGEIDKLLQEAISQARVPHPNVVTIYYVGKDEGNPFLAMELVNGHTLNQRIAASDLTFKETAKIGLQLAEALRASFELDIIHGDIKPSNVLISRDGNAKLSDFGMARIASENKTVAAGGTPNYLAPELLRGATTSPQSDMYALGVTLFEMTFGDLPIKMRGNKVRGWIETHEKTNVEFPEPWPPDLPESWRTVLTKLLAKAPEDRFEDYDQLIGELERLQPNPNVTARFLPRLTAAAADWALVLLITVTFYTALRGPDPDLGWKLDFLTITSGSQWVIVFLTFLPIIGYTFAVYYFRQTLGRLLMHLKVVNQYGLRPSGRQMAIRSVLRMQFAWIVIFATLLFETPLRVVGLIAFIGGVMFFLVDLLYMLIASNGTSFHDWFARTRVVLDTDEQ